MSVEVFIIGWKPGFRKISTTQLLQKHAMMGLRQAKEAVDRVLAGERVSITLENENQAIEVFQQLQLFGAIVDAPMLHDQLLSNIFIDWMEQALFDILSTPVENEMRLVKTRAFIDAIISELAATSSERHKHIRDLIYHWHKQEYINGWYIHNNKEAKDWLEAIFGTIDGIITP